MSPAAQPKGEDASEHPIGRWPRWWLRAAPWPVLLLALALMVAYFWVYRQPTVAMVGSAYYGDFCLGSCLFGLLAAGRGVQLAVRNAYEARFGGRPGACRSRRRFWPWFASIAAGTYVMLWFELPMHASFTLSRPALGAIADEAVNDPANAHLMAGRWAGLYPIAGVEVVGDTVVLYLVKDSGSYGFARVPNAANDVIFNMTGLEDNPHHHADFPQKDGRKDPQGKRIVGDWFVVYSQYWRVKVGWS